MRKLTGTKFCYVQLELNAIKMVGYSAVGCSNSSTNNILSFHCLPKSIELRETCLQAIRRVDVEDDQKVVMQCTF